MTPVELLCFLLFVFLFVCLYLSLFPRFRVSVSCLFCLFFLSFFLPFFLSFLFYLSPLCHFFSFSGALARFREMIGPFSPSFKVLINHFDVPALFLLRRRSDKRENIHKACFSWRQEFPIPIALIKRVFSVNTYSWISTVPRGSEQSEWVSLWMERASKARQVSLAKRSVA